MYTVIVYSHQQLIVRSPLELQLFVEMEHTALVKTEEVPVRIMVG